MSFLIYLNTKSWIVILEQKQNWEHINLEHKISLYVWTIRFIKQTSGKLKGKIMLVHYAVKAYGGVHV
jgi:hypothetical protein